jgi:hypothetical protein
MKKIISGRIYDTDSARKIGEFEFSGRGDFHWYMEVMYLKKTGEFFIHGMGNAASPYRTTVAQNEWSEGEKIIPLTYETARTWCEEHISAEEYVSIFGEPEDEEGSARLHVQVSAGAMSRLRKAQSREGKPMSQIIEDLILNNL